MNNFSDLMGNLLQNAMSPSGQKRMGNALEQLQRDGLGALGQAGSGSGDLLGGLFDMVQGGLRSASENPMKAGGIGAVLGSVLGGGGSSVKGALGGGALAMLAGVAIKALANSGQGSSLSDLISGGSLPLGLRQPETPGEQETFDATAALVVRGMINAAKADRRVDAEEMERIVGRLREGGLDDETQQWLMEEIGKPLDLPSFAAEIPNAEAAAQVYAASLLAIEVDTDAERNYLDEFAARTGLASPVAREIDRTMGIA